MGLPFDFGFAREGDYVENTMQMVTSKLQYQFQPQWTLEWTLGWLSQHHDFDHMYLGRYNRADRRLYSNYSWVDATQRTLSNSFMLNGKYQTGSLTHQLMLGYDFSNETKTNNAGSLLNSTRFGVDPYDRSSWPVNTHRQVEAENTPKAYDLRSQALFFNNVTEFTPTFKLALGGRWDRYDINFGMGRFGEHNFKGSSFSPSIGAVWTVAPQHNVYASWSRSFSPMGGNAYLTTLRSNPAHLNKEPEYNKQIELGIKSDWLDERLSTTVSVYQITKHNIRYRPDNNDPDRYEVAGQHRTQGIDFTLTGRLNANWHVRTSLGLMSPKVVKDVANPAREGRYLANTSRRQIGMGVRYIAPANKWFAELSGVHTGKRYPTPPADYSTALPGYTRLDATFGWRFTPSVQAVVAVQNLSDKQYWRNSHLPGAPRSINARLNYEF